MPSELERAARALVALWDRNADLTGEECAEHSDEYAVASKALRDALARYEGEKAHGEPKGAPHAE